MQIVPRRSLIGSSTDQEFNHLLCCVLTTREWHGTWQVLAMWRWQWVAVEVLLALMDPDESRTTAGWWSR